MTSRGVDVVIAGAGIVGAACADVLSREGFRVLVVDPHDTGSGATAAGMGHVVVLDDSEAQFALTKYSRDRWHDLREALPSSVEFDAGGTLWIAADGEEWRAAVSKQSWYEQRGVKASLLDSKSLAEAEPNLRPELAGALWIQGDIVLYAPAAAHFLLSRARSRGATFSRGVRLQKVLKGAVALTDETVVNCGVVVFATGSAAGDLFPWLKIRPRKGHLAITARYPGFLRHQLVELGYLKSAHGHAQESVAFNAQPRATGQVLIGSSRQYDVTAAGIDHGILSRMLQRAIEFLPALAELKLIRTWTGFRAATEDQLPIIGQLDRPDVFVASGHEGLGITTSLGTAELLADLILKREPRLDPAPYSPARFQREAALA